MFIIVPICVICGEPISSYLRKHGECFVFGLLHDFTLARAFIVDAAQVQDAMDDDPMKLGFIRSVELFGIGALPSV